MQKLSLPEYQFRFRSENEKDFIFDRWRKKYVSLTPEEWVRQNFIMFLVEEKTFPASRIAVEKGLKVGKRLKRTDVVIYDITGKPQLIVECKAPEVKLSPDTFDQIIRYNISLQVHYLVVTNGLSHYCCKLDYENNSYEFLKEIPIYNKLT